jgi:DME family drug/metabolite transporter
LVVAAILFSTGGVSIKYNSLNAWQVACGRSIIAAAALWIALPAVRRKWTPRLFLVGCAYAAMLILFVSSTKLTTAANAIFLQATAPLYLMFIGPVFLKEKLRRSDWLLMIAMAVGMSFFFLDAELPVSTAPNPRLGNVLGALSGFAWALVVAGLRWVARDGEDTHAAISTVFAGNVIAAFICLAPALPVANIRWQDIAVLLFLGTCQIALAYFCVSKAMRHVPAFEASVIILVEPALNPLWTWLLLAERPGTLPLLGGAILLVATTINGWWQARGKLSAPQTGM